MNGCDGSFTTERPKIILVDDDSGVRRSLQLLLQSRGYDVRSYASSVALISDPVPAGAACLITDYIMPELDGLAVLRALRTQGWQGPAILITAYHSDELSLEAKAAGFSDVIQKPPPEHALTNSISRLLRSTMPGPSEA